MNKLMKKIEKILKNLKSKIKIDTNLIVLTLITLIIMAPFYYPGRVMSHDNNFHMFRIKGAANTIKDGLLTGSIHYNVLKSGYGTGIFYPQLSLFIPIVLCLCKVSIYIAYEVGIITLVLASAYAMYYYLKDKFSSDKIALIGSIIYTTAPYRLVQALNRGAYGELVVFIALPLVFMAIDRMIEGKKNYVILLAAAVSITIQSHIISTIWLIIFASVYGLLNINKIFNKKNIKGVILAALLTCMLSAYFLVPLFQNKQEGNYIAFSEEFGGVNYDITSHNPYIPQLLFSKGNQGYSLNRGNIEGEMSYEFGIILISLVIMVPLVWKNIKKNNRQKVVIDNLILIFMFTFFMTTTCIWNKLSFINKTQFPWRLLSYIIFSMSIVGASVVESLEIKKENFKLVVAGLIIVTLMCSEKYIVNIIPDLNGWLPKEHVDNYPIQKGEYDWCCGALGSDYEYLPKSADFKYLSSKENIDYLNKDEELNAKFEKDKNTFSSSFKVLGDSKLELPLIYYQGYDIRVNGEKYNYEESKNGMIEIYIKKAQEVNLVVKYKGTVEARIANVLSATTLFGIILYMSKKQILKLIKYLKQYKEVIMYLVFGVLTTLVNILMYTILSKCLKINYMSSNIIAIIISILFAYITNKMFVFDSKKTEIKEILKELVSFFACRGVTALMDIGLMFVTVSMLQLNDILMKILVNVLVIVLNYIFSKVIVFKK